MPNRKALAPFTDMTHTVEFHDAFAHGLWIATGVVAGLCIFMTFQPTPVIPPYMYTYKMPVAVAPVVPATAPVPAPVVTETVTPNPASAVPVPVAHDEHTDVPVHAPTTPAPTTAAPVDMAPAPNAASATVAPPAPTPPVDTKPVVRTEPPPAPVVKITLPVPGMYTDTPPFGKLPNANKDGERPFDAYRRTFNKADLEKPLIALVMTDVGLSTQNTTKTLDALTGPISVTVSQYAMDAGKWAQKSYDAGHEIWLDLSVQPNDYPESDPGANAILIQNTIQKNKTALMQQLGSMVGYAGIFEKSQSPIFQPEGKADLVVADLFARGLGLVLNEPSPDRVMATEAAKTKSPYYAGEMITITNGGDATAAFDRAEAVARANGYAIVIFRPAPYAVTQIVPWTKTLHDKGIALAPLSVIAERGLDLMK